MQTVIESITVEVDENGRITLPSFVREQMQLKPGTTLIVEAAENAEIHLRVLPETAELVNEDGIWVISAEPIGDIEGAIEHERELRMASFFDGVDQQ